MRRPTKNEEIWIMLATLIIGGYIIFLDPKNSSNIVAGLLAIAFGISNSSYMRNIFKLGINFIFRREIFHIERSKISQSNIFGRANKVEITQIFGDRTKRLGLDEVKIKILSFLNEEFNKNAHNWITHNILSERLGLSMEQLTPHIKYLEGKGYIKVEWGLGGFFSCQITSDGIDALNDT